MNQVVVSQHDVPIPSLPATMSPLRIAHVSDFHFRHWSRFLNRFQRTLTELEFDLLVLTGDVCQWPCNYRQGARLLRRLLEPIRPPLGLFVIVGNHDSRLLADEFKNETIRFLQNESVELRSGDAAINIAGTDDSFRGVADLPKTLNGCRNGHMTILLSHLPSAIHYLPEDLVEIVLSGHTHAGQWRLPGWGSMLVNDHIERHQTHGLHRIGRRWLYVTAGVGVSGPFFLRLNCPAEIALLKLVRAEAEPSPAKR